jgi:type IV secretory pathway TraG/TraD family ATPase VirD4
MLSTIAQISDTENPTIFPFPFAMHITLAVISVIFFTYRFMVQKRPFQLIFAIAVPLSLILWLPAHWTELQKYNKTIFYTIGAIECALILLALVTTFICKPKKEEAAAAADAKADAGKDTEEDDEDEEE